MSICLNCGSKLPLTSMPCPCHIHLGVTVCTTQTVLDRIAALEAEVRELKARMPKPTTAPPWQSYGEWDTDGGF